MKRTWLSALGYAALVAIVGGALAYAFWPRPLPVDVGLVSRGEMKVTVGGEGKTRVKEVYVVSAPVAGRVLRIDVHAGDAVRGGETVVASIQPADPGFLDIRSKAQAEANVQAAAAAHALALARLAQAQAEMEFAAADLRRARTLAVKGTISQRDLERAQLAAKTRDAEVASAAAAVAQADHELRSARAALLQPGQAGDGAECCVDVRAPATGSILRVFSESEGVVAVGTPIMEIGDPGDLEIVVDLLSTDAVKVAPGAEVIIEHWGSEIALNGFVHRVEPSGFTKVSALGIEEQRVNAIIDLADPKESWQRLGDGYRVEVRIVVWRSADALRVPTGALFRETADWAVFRVVDGRSRLQRLTLGQRNDIEAQVLDGLAPGDVVILHPSDEVRDGDRVERRD